MNDQTTSIYIHIPFCQHRCAYCDFNTYSGLEELIPSYVEALYVKSDGLESK
jgi:oxygen-independent coproporphyrinogen-3 oxidase